MSGRLHSLRLSVSCILIGVAILCVGVFLAIQVEKQKSWSPALAQVVESEWEESGEQVGLRVRVKYEVDGQPLKTSFFIEDWANDHEEQQSYGPISIAPETIPSMYLPGAEIQILHDPENAGSAVLEPGGHAMNLYAILFGLALIGFGLISPVHSLLIWRANNLMGRVEREMLEFITNIRECEKILADCPNERTRKALSKRHEALIKGFEVLYGEYEQFAEELEDGKSTY